MARILLVEDEVNVLKMTQMMLSRDGHDVTGYESGQAAIERVKRDGAAGHGLEFDVVLTDYRLKDATGLDVLRAVKSVDASTQVLLVTAYATTQTAVEAMRDGAFDYIEKPFKRDELLALIHKAEARRTITREKVVYTHQSEVPKVLPNFVGESAAMKSVLELVTRVAPTRANILITGESGTGKEVIARAVHRLSGMSGPFVPVNCGAIPETLVESEFFGYAKGAFTGATRDKPGFFQAAKGGSLVLDEIGELPLSMQVKLLRAIQEKKVQPVGSPNEVPVSVRIIAATNRDLRAEVDAHRFREDLFFRLNVIQVCLPPLRERVEEIPALIHHFLQKFNEELGKTISGVAPDAMNILMSYDYRGNVRELENILEHAATLELSNQITASSLPAYLHNGIRDGQIHVQPTAVSGQRRAVSRSKLQPVNAYDSSDLHEAVALPDIDVAEGIELEGIVEDLERSLIEKSLAQTDGNKTEAAKLLGISFRSLRYRLKKYGYE
ncbi:MAG: sigma-54-dependent Fis family transcriptional regulator [Proteobacteria bacterium]|nr:sigma-54-dependent Fis family transcriptional regulator [Pseudomonadota bacterium]